MAWQPHPVLHRRSPEGWLLSNYGTEASPEWKYLIGGFYGDDSRGGCMVHVLTYDGGEREAYMDNQDRVFLDGAYRGRREWDH